MDIRGIINLGIDCVSDEYGCTAEFDYAVMRYLAAKPHYQQLIDYAELYRLNLGREPIFGPNPPKEQASQRSSDPTLSGEGITFSFLNGTSYCFGPWIDSCTWKKGERNG